MSTGREVRKSGEVHEVEEVQKGKDTRTLP